MRLAVLQLVVVFGLLVRVGFLVLLGPLVLLAQQVLGAVVVHEYFGPRLPVGLATLVVVLSWLAVMSGAMVVRQFDLVAWAGMFAAVLSRHVVAVGWIVALRGAPVGLQDSLVLGAFLVWLVERMPNHQMHARMDWFAGDLADWPAVLEKILNHLMAAWVDWFAGELANWTAVRKFSC